MNKGLYDTVGLLIGWSEETRSDILKIVGSSKCRHKKYPIQFYCKNMRVSIDEKGVYVIGSLAKYYYGNNINPLHYADVEAAIMQLSLELNLNLFLAQVVRVDLVATFEMSNPVRKYFDSLGWHQKLRRWSFFDETLYYDNRNKLHETPAKQLSFYSKGAESPELGLSDRWLRYEMKLQKRVQQQLKFPTKITVAMLADKEFCGRLLQMWKDEYLQIDKMPQIIHVEQLEMAKTAGEAKDLLLTGLLSQEENRNPVFLTDYYSRLKCFGNLNRPDELTRLKKLIQKLFDEYTETKTNDLILELDDKILSTAV